MKVTGGCHCGQITYEAEVNSATVRVCHCTDCQRLTGTPFRVNISARPETFKLKSGMPKNYVRTAESGNKCAHAFCPECGTPIYVIPAVLSGHRFCPRSSGEGRDAFGHLHQLVPGATTCLDDGVVAVPDTVA